MGLYNMLHLKNEGIELIFCMLMHSVRKAKSYFGYPHGQYGRDISGPGTLKSALSHD